MEDTQRPSLAQRFNLHPGTMEDGEQDDDEVLDEDSEYTAFAVNKQLSRREEMIDIVFKDGRREAFSYSHLYRITFDPKEGIELYFSEHVVRIQGIRLLWGYRRLRSFRVMQIEQADAPTAKLAARDGVVVTELGITRVVNEALT